MAVIFVEVALAPIILFLTHLDIIMVAPRWDVCRLSERQWRVNV